MTTPQGPDRYGADRDPEQAPTWGAPPPGGWGEPDPGPPTGAWDARYDDGPDDHSYDDSGYTGRRRAEDQEGWDAPAPWGDQPDPDGAGYGGQPSFGAGRPGGADPWSDTGETAVVPWTADADQGRHYAPGDEPWAAREDVRTPRRGPGGPGRGALAGIIGGVVVVAALLFALFVTPGWALTRTLDQTALQNGVTQILTQTYGLQVGAVQCPDDVTVEADTAFSCQALVDGEQVTVPGVVTTDAGDYQVKRV